MKEPAPKSVTASSSGPVSGQTTKSVSARDDRLSMDPMAARQPDHDRSQPAAETSGRPSPKASTRSFDSDEIAARFGFERRITAALADAGKTRPGVTDAMVADYENLIRDCYLMKGTLFNAAKRLERQHAAGQFTFALSGIYGFLVPLFALQFEPFLTALVTNIVSFTAATAGAISFVVAMIYQQQDLSRQARGFHEAGLKMNKLRRRLQITPLTSPDQLSRSNHDYDDIFLTCNNHDDIDFEFAKLGRRPQTDVDGSLSRWRRQRLRLNLRFAFHTFSLVTAVWTIPPLVGLGIWWSLASSQIATASQIAR